MFNTEDNHNRLWFLLLSSEFEKRKTMKCPFCKSTNNNVLDSRLTSENESIRRRRGCRDCNKRFTTYEKVEMFEASVLKRDGRREQFSREKVLKGIMKACEKRPVRKEEVDKVVDAVESYVLQSEKEVRSRKIGELIMDELAKLDDVAYVRFASVYKKFKDADQFVDAIKTLKKTEAERNRRIAVEAV